MATILMVSPLFAADEADHIKRVREAADVLGEILNAKDGGIPDDLLNGAHCIGVVPNLKRAGFIVGAKYGKGVISCRTATGWSAPSMIQIEGGNIGLQIGAGETDVVFVVNNAKGEEKLMKSKFTIGADASAMAGPVGRSLTAQTDAAMRAEILSYSRSRGVFAGVTLDGATLRADDSDNRKVYGRDVTQEEILHGKVQPTAAATPFLTILKRYPGKKVG